MFLLLTFKEFFSLRTALFCISVWGVSLTLRLLWLCRNNPARGLFRQKNGFLRVGALCRRTRCSLLHTALFWHLYAGGVSHYPRRALHAVETLDAQELRRRIRRFYAVSEFAPCGQNIPSAGTHATPAPNRAHSGSHGETRGLLSPGHSVALCCQRNCHRKNSRRKWMHALRRVSAFAGAASPQARAAWTLLFPQP